MYCFRVLLCFLFVSLGVLAGVDDDDAASPGATSWHSLPTELRFHVLSESLASTPSYEEYSVRRGRLMSVSKSMRNLVLDRTLKAIPVASDDCLHEWIRENPGCSVLGLFIHVAPAVTLKSFPLMMQLMPYARHIQMDWRQLTPHTFALIEQHPYLTSVTLEGNAEFWLEEWQALYGWAQKAGISVYHLNSQGEMVSLFTQENLSTNPEHSFAQMWQQGRLDRLKYYMPLDPRAERVLRVQGMSLNDNELKFLIFSLKNLTPNISDAPEYVWQRLTTLLRGIYHECPESFEGWWRECLIMADSEIAERLSLANLCQDSVFPYFQELLPYMKIDRWLPLFDLRGTRLRIAGQTAFVSLGRRLTLMENSNQVAAFQRSLMPVYERTRNLTGGKSQLLSEWMGIQLGRDNVSVQDVDRWLDFALPVMSCMSYDNAFVLVNLLLNDDLIPSSIGAFLHLLYAMGPASYDVDFESELMELCEFTLYLNNLGVDEFVRLHRQVRESFPFATGLDLFAAIQAPGILGAELYNTLFEDNTRRFIADNFYQQNGLCILIDTVEWARHCFGIADTSEILRRLPRYTFLFHGLQTHDENFTMAAFEYIETFSHALPGNGLASRLIMADELTRFEEPWQRLLWLELSQKLRLNFWSPKEEKRLFDRICANMQDLAPIDVIELIDAMRSVHLTSVPEILPYVRDALAGFPLGEILNQGGQNPIELYRYTPQQLMRALARLTSLRDHLIMGIEVEGESDAARLHHALKGLLNYPVIEETQFLGDTMQQLHHAFMTLERIGYRKWFHDFFMLRFADAINEGVPASFVWQTCHWISEFCPMHKKRFVIIAMKIAQILYQQFPRGVQFSGSQFMIDLAATPHQKRLKYLRKLVKHGIPADAVAPVPDELPLPLLELQMQMN